MVVIHVKRSEKDEFLYETSTTTQNQQLIRELVQIANLRILLTQTAHHLSQAAQFGPMKEPSLQGIDSIQEEAGLIKLDKNEYYQEDPLGIRNGNGVGPVLTTTFEKVAQDAIDAVSSKQVQMKIPLTLATLQEKRQNMKGAVMMGFPMGLPTYDVLHPLLQLDNNPSQEENIADILAGTQASTDILDPLTAKLWWAGKEFFPDEYVWQRVGKNEKTKIVVKFSSGNGTAPQREPAVSEDERKAMMAKYFQKQQQLKELAEADEDDYLHSSWANPNQLKESLRGTQNIRPF